MRPIETHDLGDLYSREINNIDVKMKVTAKVYIDDTFDIEDVEDAEDKKRFGRGDLCSYLVVIEATAEGLKGSDVLGGIWASNNEDIFNSVEDNEMVEVALDDLANNIKSTAERLKRFIVKEDKENE